MSSLAEKMKAAEERKQKAQDFINQGTSAKAEEQLPKSKNKKYVSYYLDKELIRKIKIAAAMNDEQPAHFIEKVILDYFSKTDR